MGRKDRSGVADMLRVHVRLKTAVALKEGRKPSLVQLEDTFRIRYHIGRLIRISHGDYGARFRITAIRNYRSLAELLDKEDLAALAHGGRSQAEANLSEVYPPLPPAGKRFVVLDLERVLTRKPR